MSDITYQRTEFQPGVYVICAGVYVICARMCEHISDPKGLQVCVRANLIVLSNLIGQDLKTRNLIVVKGNCSIALELSFPNT